jgi:hypothetical protein
MLRRIAEVVIVSQMNARNCASPSTLTPGLIAHSVKQPLPVLMLLMTASILLGAFRIGVSAPDPY